MGSTQKGTVYQMVKTSKTGSRVGVSAQRGAEVSPVTTPYRGHGYLLTSSQRSAAVPLSPSTQRRSEATNFTTPPSASDYPRSISPKSGPSVSATPIPRGTELRSRTEGSRHSSPHRKSQQIPTSRSVSIYQNVSPVRGEAARRGGETKSPREISHYASSTPDTKSLRWFNFFGHKDNLQSQIVQDDPPSKVQNPQGVRVPRKISAHPKDEAVQTEPTRRILTSEARRSWSPLSPERGSSRVYEQHRTVQRRTPVEEPEMGPQRSVLPDPKASYKNTNLESSLKLSSLRDLESGHRVSVRPDHREPLRKHYAYPAETKPPAKVLISSEMESNLRSPIRGDNELGRRVTISPGEQPVLSTSRRTTRSGSRSPHRSSMLGTPEPAYKQQTQRPRESMYMSSGPSRKPSIHAELELTPRPLPPRSLPRYEPDSSWWDLLNLEVETPQSRPTTPDFEPKSPSSVDPLLSHFKAYSSSFCEDVMSQREKASPPPPSPSPPPPPPPKDYPSRGPLREVLQAAKHTCKQPIQRFSAFFLDVSEEMYNRVIWWLKGMPGLYFSVMTDEEDDKEYVGFATLPNQVHRKSVKKGFDFTLMVAGESGLGKSTLVNSLFLTDLYRDRKLLSAEERIMQTVEITKHAVDIEEKGVRLRLTIVDTPGFGDAVNNTDCWKPVAEYIDQQFEQYFRDESGLNRKNIQDNRVHCCLYFISPFGHGLRPLDVEFMKALHQRVNIVPILAKADTLTPLEVDHKKRKIREEIEHFGIKIYQFPDCDSDEDEDFKLQDQALKESIPFAVIGSNTVVEARGRRVRGRLYPWGIVEVENPGHCDFVKLRTMLVRTHMQDLKDVTRETHYENYRAQCIQSMTRLVVKERNRKYDHKPGQSWQGASQAQSWVRPSPSLILLQALGLMQVGAGVLVALPILLSPFPQQTDSREWYRFPNPCCPTRDRSRN
nr:septin-4 isoform X4 [Microcebus murinus]